MKRPDFIFFNKKNIWFLLIVVLTFAACSGDKEKTSGGSEEETQGIAIEDKTVAGVTQKGPFINGSSVTLFELNGTDLLQTGNSFVGKIKSDKGDFSISGINLVSPYAFLEAKGYYRNEVSGKKSVSEITLNAVTNLENRDNVNVNLLTHLEYERVQGLVKKNVDIASAKEQAEKEIFTSFYVEEDAESFEDLNIFKTGEDDAVLLAISVLMQGDRSEAELSELLANYSYDVESDGIWNDEEAKAEIADWAEKQTLSTGLENIRKNIEDWKFGTAPGFEKYVMRFWWYNYGLGLCDAKNEGSIKKNENELSANVGIRYICRNNFWYRYGEQSSSSEAFSSSSQGSVIEEAQGIAIEDKTVAGVTQKGPFINGSSVTLFELNGTDLLQTGNSFVGKIKSDKGDFSISGINLVSPYAFLEAKGYYRNEVSGKKSVSEITLNAVTNLENRDNVNVNLLTHLEYERILNLVKKKSDFTSAKEQAEMEIFNSFYMNENVESFEDLSIFGTGEDDAVLLAISVLMQGERSETELSELLASYSDDIKLDGIWGDEDTKAKIADWAEMQSLSPGLENIRKNIEGWGSSSVPEFEKYVMRFWWYNYGLGLCNAENEGVIKKNGNNLSANASVQYICNDNSWYRYKQSWQYLNQEKEYGEFIDSRDNQTYKTIEICDSEKKVCQTWMAENLNYAIEQGSQNAYDSKSVCGGFSLNQQGDCDTYGRLYAWDIAMDACPTEWHLPSHDEFQKLLDLVSEYSSTAGAKLKTSSNLWTESASDNSSGFSALPAGNRYFGVGSIAYFWSSTEDDVNQSYMMQIDSYNATLVRTEKGHLNSVRCVK